MSTIYLEHANITVNNLDNAVHFFKTAFPHFELRGGGESNGRKWIHFGDATTYVALNTSLEKKQLEKNYESSGINHIGFVVSDVDSIAKRLSDAGYGRSFPKQVEQFRIRDYFYDKDGNEYEFVEYLSEKESERNLYA
ncbi:MAG: VOC family protein [bacterium]|nr:VOC family protein [bacterium]